MDYHLVETAFTPDPAILLAKLGLDAGSDEAADFLALLERAAPAAKPKAVLGVAPVEAREDAGRVVLGGHEFRSALMAENLKGVDTVWPYLATCGRELYDLVQAIPDPFERYWGDEIMYQALNAARDAMLAHLAENVYAGKTAAMGPGSLKEWPIHQQAPLFRLFGDAARRCGVTLTDSFLMLPNKSVSGIRFPNEHGYVNCQLCPRDKCPNRKAPFDAVMAKMGA